MRLEEHVLKAIKDYEQGDLEPSLMHACFAIEATARNLYKKDNAKRNDLIECIRSYYWIIEPMIGGGINQNETLFNNLKIYNEYGKLVINPDLADVIYHIFRCNHAHAKEVPLSFQLLPSEDAKSRWEIGENILKMPDRIIWALLAVSVFANCNSHVSSSGDFFLSWGSETLGLGTTCFLIKDSWGKEKNFRNFLSRKNPNPTRVRLEGLDGFVSNT